MRHKSQTERTITVDGVSLHLIIERKAVKNINSRLRDDTLYVSAPHAIGDDDLDRMVISAARTLLRRVQARQANTEHDVLAVARTVATRFPQAPAITDVQFVTTQQACWGSYSTATQRIRLHALLRRMPSWVLESVIAHELAHAFHPDHSPAFWSLLRQVCPETDRAESFLAGVAWLSQKWETIPEVERALLP